MRALEISDAAMWIHPTVRSTQSGTVNAMTRAIRDARTQFPAHSSDHEWNCDRTWETCGPTLSSVRLLINFHRNGYDRQYWCYIRLRLTECPIKQGSNNKISDCLAWILGRQHHYRGSIYLRTIFAVICGHFRGNSQCAASAAGVSSGARGAVVFDFKTVRAGVNVKCLAKT